MTEDRWAAFVDWLAGEEILTTIEGNRRTRPSTHHGLFGYYRHLRQPKVVTR